jgi:hypothetical protein
MLFSLAASVVAARPYPSAAETNVMDAVAAQRRMVVDIGLLSGFCAGLHNTGSPMRAFVGFVCFI